MAGYGAEPTPERRSIRQPAPGQERPALQVCNRVQPIIFCRSPLTSPASHAAATCRSPHPPARLVLPSLCSQNTTRRCTARTACAPPTPMTASSTTPANIVATLMLTEAELIR